MELGRYNDRLGRDIERGNARYERENRRSQRDTATRSPNASADAFVSMVRDRQFETAQGAVRDARHDLARLRREHAHPDDIAFAREVLDDAREDLAAVRDDD